MSFNSAVDITPPSHDSLAASAPTVIVAHGLTGGSYESYVRNILEWVVRPKAHGGLGGRGVVANVSLSATLVPKLCLMSDAGGEYSTGVVPAHL